MTDIDLAMKDKITIALAGNPNAGKTTVFNALTGAHQHIANYPGVTVEKKYGTIFYQDMEIEVVDLPGTYSLSAYSLEEIVARDFLVSERPDLVVDIVDASNLDRNLYLAVQLMELGAPLIIALNMMDLAESRGIVVDAERLEQLLGVPVVAMVARSHKGLKELVERVVEVVKGGKLSWRPARLSYGRDIDQSLEQIEEILESTGTLIDKYPPRWIGLKCLEGDKQILELLAKYPEANSKIKDICQQIASHTLATLEEEPEGIIAEHRYGYIAGITKKVVKRKIEARLNASDQIDQVLTNRVLGPVFMVLILYAIYTFTFWASELPLRWTERFFELLKQGVLSVIPPGPFQSLLVAGVIDGVGGVMGFVPLIMFMFFAIAILEDSGYMARVAYMLDRVLRWFGLHGSSVIALIVSGGISGGCAVPGVLATRTLSDPKERIATILVAPFMNCGAKLPVYAMLIAAFFAEEQAKMLFILTLLSWAFALLGAKFLRSTVLRGPKTPFVMELPPYRVPTLRGLLIHTWERTWQYIKKAGTIILAFSILFWAMMTYPGPSPELLRGFEESQQELSEQFLNKPAIRGLVSSKSELADLNALYEKYSTAQERGDEGIINELSSEKYFPFVKAVILLENGQQAPPGVGEGIVQAVGPYLEYRRAVSALSLERQRAILESTVAGWLGSKLEFITRPLGFDHRVNIALVGGFAAKEVVISTLGTAYSLGQAEGDLSPSLSTRIKNDPLWNPLQAFVFLIFTMLYVPCLPTVIAIKKESSWGWAAFSIGFNLMVAYFVALGIRQAGASLGLG